MLTRFEFEGAFVAGVVGAIADVGVCVMFELLTCAIKYEHTCHEVGIIPSSREVTVGHAYAHN